MRENLVFVLKEIIIIVFLSILKKFFNEVLEELKCSLLWIGFESKICTEYHVICPRKVFFFFFFLRQNKKKNLKD